MKTLISIRLNKLDLITLALFEFWLSYPFDFSLFNENVKDERDLPIDEVTKIITLQTLHIRMLLGAGSLVSVIGREMCTHSSERKGFEKYMM